MATTFQLSNFRYSYDYLEHSVIDKGDYGHYQVYTTSLDLNRETPAINKHNGKLSQQNRNTLGVIELCYPVVNYILAGNEGSLLASILGISSELMKNIIGCSTFYDVTTDTHDVRSIDNTHKYLSGALYLHKLIDDLDIDEEIQKVIKGLAWKCINKHKVKADSSLLNTEALVLKDSNAHEAKFNLFNDYYLNPQYEDLFVTNWEKKKDKWLGESLNSDMSRLFLLCNMPKDKSSLYGMVAPFVLVLPYDYRRGTGASENRAHPMTTLYQHIIEANASLIPCVQSAEVTSTKFQTLYERLTRAVNAVYYNRDLSLSQGDKSAFKSLSQALSAKPGIIRGECLGKREDYSGRSVVSIKPDLSLTSINLPKDMVISMFEYHALPELYRRLQNATEDSPLHGLSLSDIHGSNLQRSLLLKEELFDIITKWPYENGQCMLKCIPVFMGRQPTLHKHSYQSFFIGVSDTNTIQVNPLVCPGYNMDFDGDQAYVNVPMHKQAINEVAKLMSTPQTIYLAKTGESTIEPRQDMLYGLYVCTQESNLTDPQAMHTNITTPQAAFEAVCSNTYAVWDTCTINGVKETIGDAAFMYCFAPNDMPSRHSGSKMKVTSVGKKTIAKYVNYLLSDEDGHKPYSLDSLGTAPGTFVGSINHLVRLGFAVAKYYPPNVSLVDTTKSVGDIDVDGTTLNYEQCMVQLQQMINQVEFYYNFGIDTQTTYEEHFSEAAGKVKKCIEKGVKKSLDVSNGYRLMAESGARGNTSNLAQIFRYKGQIQKDSTSSFNAVIEHGYKEQLSPMEFFVNSYGGRQGQIDKSLKTADTGYFARCLWHSTQGYTITTHDCGTTDGIEISYDFLQHHFPDDDTYQLLEDWLTDHHLVSIRYPDTGYEKACNNEFITKDKAIEYSKDSKAIYKLRSPITCKNPCCQVCYGIDPSTHRPPVIGTAVGIIAAQSIGEISTQATMKTFQKGGSSGASAVSSSFDRAKSLLSMQKLTYKSTGFDPVAWANGRVQKMKSDIPGTYAIAIVDDEDKPIPSPVGKVFISKNVDVKDVAVKGVGLSRIRGDYSMQDLITIMGPDYAQVYLVGKLRTVYASTAKLKFIHYEILVASLARYLILSTDRNTTTYASDGTCTERALLVGAHVTAQELYCGSLNNTTYRKRLLSYKGIQFRSLDALDTIQMENLGKGIARSTLLHMDDTLNKPINRMVMAKGILSGSHKANYIDDSFRR